MSFHSTETTTGVVVTIYWSAMGRQRVRRSRWTRAVNARWSPTRPAGDTWVLPAAASLIDIEALFADGVLLSSDKAIVVFPHGRRGGRAGPSSMSVHYYNCQ